MTDERAAFEKWAEPILGDNPTWRESGDCELAWQAWQARAIIEASASAQPDSMVSEATHKGESYRWETPLPPQSTADTVLVPSDGVALIAQERERQIQKEGWDAKHDLEHKPGELATAGYHYAANAAACLGMQPGSLHIWDNWPWHPSWWKPTTPQRDLVKAGALIAAEIDRLIAAAPKDTTP